MHTDIYLRADTEANLKAAIPWAVHQAAVPDGPDAGDWKLGEAGLFALDLIGAVVTQDAVVDPEDPEVVITPAVIDSGFHANLRLIGAYQPDIPASVVVYPTAPRRVFA